MMIQLYIITTIRLLLLFLPVFADDVKLVWVSEGQSLVLHADISVITRGSDVIIWTFGPDSTRIAQMEAKQVWVFQDVLGGKFRGRVGVSETGSLHISNSTAEDSGLYQLHLISSAAGPPQSFSVAVLAPLPIPVVVHSCSSSVCLLVCEVENVSHVTLSWYKGESLFSSISVSDLSRRVSLPLEIQSLNDSYTCVLNNSIRQQNTHLQLLHTFCHTCSEESWRDERRGFHQSLLVIIPVCVLLLTSIVIFIYRQTRRSSRAGAAGEQETAPLTPSGSPLQLVDSVKTVKATPGQSLTLHTGVPEVQSLSWTQWKFSQVGPNSLTNQFVVVAQHNTPAQSSGEEDPRFRGRVELDTSSGVLTIRHLRREELGMYRVNVRRGEEHCTKTFMVQESTDEPDEGEDAEVKISEEPCD